MPMDFLQAGNSAVAQYLKNLGLGKPLEPQARAEMERAYGADFSEVRVHESAEAQGMAAALNAEAFTNGDHIYLGSDAPSVESNTGRALLAHELAHVTQQRRAEESAATRISKPGDQFELAADESARAALHGEQVTIATAGAPPAIQRQPSRTEANEAQSQEIAKDPLAFILAQLRRRFNVDTDPRLIERRKLLVEAFEVLDSSQAKKLSERLTKRPKEGDEAYDGFHTLHDITQAVLLRILRRKVGEGESYQKAIKEATTLLSSVSFGRCEGRLAGPDVGDKYDDRYWEEVDVSVPNQKNQQAELVLKSTIKPSFAIDEIFSNLELWSFDCAEFVQVSELYAFRHSLGAKAFDARVSGTPFTLRSQNATGVDTKKIWSRAKAQDPLTRFEGPGSGSQETKSVDAILADAPTGSRVVWTNTDSKADGTNFKNENTVKLGTDLFHAHPFGDVSRKEVELKLAQEVDSSLKTAEDAYVKKNIFISRIEIYRTP